MKKLIILILMIFVAGIANAQTWYSWRYREHATDCTTLADGKARDLCFEIDDETIYKCEPDAGDCSGAEWKPLGSAFTDIDTDYGAETVTSAWNFIANGTGVMAAYDLKIGDTTTPDYGALQLGQIELYASSHSSANLDLDKAFVIRNGANLGVGNDPGIEFAFMESGNTIRLAIPESGSDNATAFIRSGTFAGPYTSTIGNNIVSCDQWTAYDSNIDCDTGGTGADLFVQDDLEVEGEIFSSGTIHLDADDANQLTISATSQTAAHGFDFPDDEIVSGDLIVGDGAGSFVYTAKSAVALSDFNDDVTLWTDLTPNL